MTSKFKNKKANQYYNLNVYLFSSHNTWEPLEYLNCSDLIREYEGTNFI